MGRTPAPSWRLKGRRRRRRMIAEDLVEIFITVTFHLNYELKIVERNKFGMKLIELRK